MSPAEARVVRQLALQARRDEFLTVKEFAFLFKLHPGSVWRRIRARRQLGAVRVGGEVRVDITKAVQPIDTPMPPAVTRATPRHRAVAAVVAPAL